MSGLHLHHKIHHHTVANISHKLVLKLNNTAIEPSAALKNPVYLLEHTGLDKHPTYEMPNNS